MKDFYLGIITEEHSYRLHVAAGAREPLEISFKEQGDYNADARPDTVAFRHFGEELTAMRIKDSRNVSAFLFVFMSWFNSLAFT